MDSSIWLIIGLIAGGVIGGVATWSISRARGGAVSIMKLKQENDKYRNEVTEHFVETARLINQMTDSYKQVFDHLSRGAETLVDDKQLAERLPPASGQEVRLGGFGSASASDPDSQSSTPKENTPTASSGRAASSGSNRGRPARPAEQARTQSARQSEGRGNIGTSDIKSDPLKSGSDKSAAEKSESGKADSNESGATEANSTRQTASAEAGSKKPDSSTAGKPGAGGK